MSETQLCDGIFDCPDLSDECLCEKELSKTENSICKNLCLDIGKLSREEND